MDVDPTWFSDQRKSRRALGARWASFGPYYAMFPVSFAREVIAEHTRRGDGVLDPFAGRGTSLFCAREAHRHALGVEINPLGWIYGSVKLAPAEERRVLACIDEIGAAARGFETSAAALPEFFHRCFSAEVRAFLLAARLLLRWRTRAVDRTAMAFILTYLHGKIERGRPSALSNQMRQTKAMAPDYSVRWWAANGYPEPPTMDPVAFLSGRVRWRYAKGAPEWGGEAMRMGDCRDVLPRRRRETGGYRLLLTSPPYRGVTSYYYDQWLRFWLLGETERPTLDGRRWKSKFDDAAAYRDLLEGSFRASQRLLAEDAVVYVRTDARPATLDVTLDVLARTFPGKRLERTAAPYARATQTSLFGDRRGKPGETDIVLRP
jgi:hypothetical protein